MSNPRKIRILLVPAELIEPVNQLSRRTLRRCEETMRLWLTGHYAYLVVTGGIFLPRSTQTLPAALLMTRLLLSWGVADSRVIVEGDSLDTYENIDNSVREIRRRLGDGSLDHLEVTVVTERSHGRRFELSFWNKYGLVVQIAPVSYPMSALDKLKECIFAAIHFIDPHGTWPMARLNRWLRRRAVVSP